MVTWREYDENITEKKWDVLLDETGDHHYMQRYGWGEFKNTSSWQVSRWLACDDAGAVFILLQGFIKKVFPRIAIFWVPGGASGDLSKIDYHLTKKIKKKYNVSVLHFRQSILIESGLMSKSLSQVAGWKKLSQSISNPQSMRLDMSSDTETLRLNLSKNWRHNLKRSKKFNLCIKEIGCVNIAEVMSIYDSMCSYKKLPQPYSNDELRHLFEKCGDCIVLVMAYNSSNQVVSLRACFLLANKAWDLLAATSLEGRRCYASYAVFWELISIVKKRHVSTYDLGGIDPKKNPGVYNFKKGTAAQLIEYDGDFVQHGMGLLSFLLNKLIGVALRFRK